jgi:hypothetical protein
MDVSLNGNDTITINNRLLTKFVDKDYGLLAFPGELATIKVGKASNAVVSFVPGGQMGDLTLRLLLSSSDDAFFNSIQRAFIQDPPSFVLMGGQLVKRSGDGQGNQANAIYNLRGGVPSAIVEAHSNADGDEEQGVAVWKFKFIIASRQLM